MENLQKKKRKNQRRRITTGRRDARDLYRYTLITALLICKPADRACVRGGEEGCDRGRKREREKEVW